MGPTDLENYKFPSLWREWVQFLFEFLSKEVAQCIILGKWKKQGKSLKLDWWLPLAGTYPVEHKFSWSWICVLGLPLHLWTANTMKELGNKCEGWIKTEEETSLKNHFLWARLKVKDSFNDIPWKVEISDGDLNFSFANLGRSSVKVSLYLGGRTQKLSTRMVWSVSLNLRWRLIINWV